MWSIKSIAITAIASYVGQTRRRLITRVNEHRNDIRKNTTNSVITTHRLDFNHDFDWSYVEILDNESCFNKRLISEMFIKRQINSLNSQTDTECHGHDMYIYKPYITALDKLPKI